MREAPLKWATTSLGTWNVSYALDLCAMGEVGPPILLPFAAVWTPKRRAGPLMPEKLAALEQEPGWRERPLLFVTVAVTTFGAPAVTMVDGAHRLSMWAREKPYAIPAYVLPLELSEIVRMA